MSTEIKPGQIWAWQDTYDARGPHGTTFEIVDASPDAPDVAYQYRDSAGMDPELVRAAPADVIRANANLVRCVCRTGTEDTCNQHSATPAPLDPSKVKAGDTVTLVGTLARAEGVVSDIHHTPSGRRNFEIDHIRFLVEGPNAWTLTDHQPAPEPEPEWKPGTVYSATVNGVPNVHVMRMGGASWGWVVERDLEGSIYKVDSEVTDVRPLVVIDPAEVDVDALVGRVLENPDWAFILGAVKSAALVNVLLHQLGIEASS